MFTSRTSFLVQVELEDSFLSFCFQESSIFECFPVASLECFFDIPWIDGIAQILRRVLPRTQRVVHHQIHGFRLRHRLIHWLWFCHRGTFTGSRFLSSLGRGTLLSDQIRKKITEMAAREHRELIMLNKGRRWFHSSRVKLPLFDMSASWFLVSTYLIWIFGSTLILSNNKIKRNSVGSGHVPHCWTSSLDEF